VIGLLLGILGLIDIIAGVLLVLNFTSMSFVNTVGMICIGKGLYSVFTGVLAGFYLDWMGWTDIIVGVALLLPLFNIVTKFFAFVIILKGIYSLSLQFVG
jgi:hypothetical protein